MRNAYLLSLAFGLVGIFAGENLLIKAWLGCPRYCSAHYRCHQSLAGEAALPTKSVSL